MKQKFYLAWFLFFFLAASISLARKPPQRIIKDLYGFKCNVNELPSPVRLTPSGSIECYSIDGKKCATGFKTNKQCENHVKRHNKLLIPIICDKKNKKVPSWCRKSRIYFFKKWRCEAETGFKLALRINPKTNNVECLSRNGITCFRGKTAKKACEFANSCEKTNRRLKKIQCGSKKFRKMWGHNGYNFRHGHWCKRTFAFFRYTGKWLGAKKTGMNMLIRLSKNGNIQCLTEDKKTCAEVDSPKEAKRILAKATKKGRVQPKTLSCGNHLFKLTKKTGFKTKDHWCSKAYNVIFKNKKPKHLKRTKRRRGKHGKAKTRKDKVLGTHLLSSPK